MVSELHIKKGLWCSFSNKQGEINNLTVFKRNVADISLSYNFGEIDFENADANQQIEFVFHSDYLNQYSPDNEQLNLNQFPQFEIRENCCNTQMILHDIVNCKYEGSFRNMYLESKALALLLCFQKYSISVQSDCSSCKFLTKPVEKEKILKVREIILSRLNNPFTIAELSLQIGINQCYLKKGFKELYGITIYDFIQEQRMLKAKMLLTNSNSSITQIADEIGFSSISNFSAAFKKHIGVLPSEFIQN